MSQDIDKCCGCKEKIKRNVDVLLCCVCTYSFHPDCENISQETYDTLKPEIDKGLILWCCKRCKVFGSTVVDMINRLSNELQKTSKSLETEKSKTMKMEEQLRSLETRVKAVETDKSEEKIEEKSKSFADAALKKYSEEFPTLQKNNVTKIVEDKVKEIKNSQPSVNIDEKLEEAEKKIREDQREIEVRKKNCIIHNLKETESEDKELKRELDMQAIDKLMSDCETDGKRPVFCVRLGKKPENANKARPLKVIFESEEEKLTLVKKYCYTKREGSAEQKKAISGISIVPDRTIKERDEYKKLLTELEERSEKGEKNLVIRNWKIRQKPTRN